VFAYVKAKYFEKPILASSNDKWVWRDPVFLTENESDKRLNLVHDVPDTAEATQILNKEICSSITQ